MKVYKLEYQFKEAGVCQSFGNDSLIGYFSNKPKNLEELFDIVYDSVAFYRFENDKLKYICNMIIEGYGKTNAIDISYSRLLRLKMTEINLKEFNNI